ncbi:unnamed protein product [Paramecium pentaurelia]|uniref:Uncharacterized protein n=1 Tax=Paramecium pentaurelia TaxID=43138 RepID=A0A8S1XNR9_9CILI|nr:unnamed protein product [Paramecium pentaurelia]
MLDSDTILESAKKYINPFLYKRPVWMRIMIGNAIPFFASIIMVELSKANQDLRTVFPPFLAHFCVAFFVCLKLCMAHQSKYNLSTKTNYQQIQFVGLKWSKEHCNC